MQTSRLDLSGLPREQLETAATSLLEEVRQHRIRAEKDRTFVHLLAGMSAGAAIAASAFLAVLIILAD